MERKPHQDCHLERVEHDRQRTRSHRCYGMSTSFTCVQETQCKGNKAKELGNGFKLYIYFTSVKMEE